MLHRTTHRIGGASQKEGQRAMQNRALAMAGEHVVSSRPEFAVETLEIRGITQRVFKNAPNTLPDLLAMAAELYAKRECLVHGSERLNYSHFFEKVQALAGALQRQVGIKSGDRVAIAMRNRIDYLIATMAIVCVGGVVVHLNAWWTCEELDYALADCDARVVFADPERIARLRYLERFSNLCVCSTVAHEDATCSIEPLLSLGRTLNLKPPVIQPDDDCSVIYTSGSTGHPKGVVLTHRNIISAIWSWLMVGPVQDYLDPSSAIETNAPEPLQPANLVTVPFFHVSGMNTCFLLTLAMGGKVVLLDKWDAERAADLIAQENITRFWGVPTMTADLLALGVLGKDRLATLGTLDAGGAKRPPDQVQQIVTTYPNIPPSTGYGMTETSGLGLRVAGADYATHPDAAGYLLPPLQEMRILDEDGTELAPGHVGELAIKSASVMRCYLNQPEATAAVLRNGWLHTGDLARIDENGLVFIVGRKKDIIIRGGENIASLEVEAAVYKHPAVFEAAVFSVPDNRLGELVGVAVQVANADMLDLQELRTFLGSHLAQFKLPERLWIFTEPLVRGATEKIDKQEIRRKCLGI